MADLINKKLDRFFLEFNDRLNRIRQNSLKNLDDAIEAIHKQTNDDFVSAKLNQHRLELLNSLINKRNSSINKINSTSLTAIARIQSTKTSSLSACFKQSKANLNSALLNNSLVIKNNFSLINKIKYLHLLVRNELSEFDLYDFKYLKSKVVYSLYLTSELNKLLTFISINDDRNEFILRIHRVDRSSFQTAREIIKKKIIHFDFVLVNQFVYCLFVSSEKYVEKYDFDLNLLSSVRLNLDKNDATNYLALLTNHSEIIVDLGSCHYVYDLNLDSNIKIGQPDVRNEPFYIGHSSKLLNITKEYLIYTKHKSIEVRNLTLVSRKTGCVVKTIDLGVFGFEDWNYTCLVDYESKMIIKWVDSSEIYLVEPSGERYLIQNKFNSDGYGIEGLFNKSFNESSTGNCLLLKKSENFFTPKYKKLIIV